MLITLPMDVAVVSSFFFQDGQLLDLGGLGLGEQHDAEAVTIPHDYSPRNRSSHQTYC